MQLSNYPYSTLTRILHTKIHGRLSELNSTDTNTERDLINSAVRVAVSDLDFKGTIRESVLTPNLMDNQWDFTLPTDADAVIDFRPQNTDSRDENETYSQVPPEEFDRRKKVEKGIYTIVSDDLTKKLRIAADVEDITLQVSSMEDTTWVSKDTDAVNDSDVKVDKDDYFEGNGSIRFQTDTTDTSDSTVGVQNTNIETFDISDYLARGSAFVDAKLTTYDTGIHQISLRLGSDSNNYYQINDSTQNDCSSFQTGWNKVRWDFSNKTTVGTPVDSAIDYACLFWSRDTTTTALLHLNDTDWGFDNLQLKRGKYYLVSYYSKNVWQDTAFTVSENSTHDSHALLMNPDEVEVVMAKAAELASGYLRDYEDVKYYNSEYERLKKIYQMKNPSQEGVLTTSRYNFINDRTINHDS